MSFPTKAEYEVFIYGLTENHADIAVSTLRLYGTSAWTAMVQGELLLNNGLKLRVLEVIDFNVGRIQTYSYAVYHNEVKIR